MVPQLFQQDALHHRLFIIKEFSVAVRQLPRYNLRLVNSETRNDCTSDKTTP
jgi:hypothetical protein